VVGRPVPPPRQAPKAPPTQPVLEAEANDDTAEAEFAEGGEAAPPTAPAEFSDALDAEIAALM
jgi:hypothetical protein